MKLVFKMQKLVFKTQKLVSPAFSLQVLGWIPHKKFACKEWLNQLRVPFVAENMDAVEPDSIRPIIDCHFCKHKICTHSSNEDYLGHLR